MDKIISIVIPCYNHGHFIHDAIESVEKCDESLYELIIVNDGSTDAYTKTVLEELQKKSYTVINQENKGLGAARNAGIRAAKGEFILPLDSDNKIRPIYLTHSLPIFRKNDDIAVVYGDSEYFGEKSGIYKAGEFSHERLIQGNYIDACAIFRKSVWEQIGGYDEDMPLQGWEDWDMWLSIAERNFKFKYLNKICFDYRYISDSMISEYRIDGSKTNKIFGYIYQKHSDFITLNISKMYFARESLIYFYRNPLHNFIKIFLKKYLNFNFLEIPGL